MVTKRNKTCNVNKYSKLICPVFKLYKKTNIKYSENPGSLGLLGLAVGLVGLEGLVGLVGIED